MKILNLGCGTKTSAHPDVVNIDWSIYLRIKRNPLLRGLASCFLSRTRRERLRALPDNVLVHNLAKGIPFPDESVDAVYHSHLLEHLDRDVAPLFLAESLRVLKPGGIIRVVVPDLERACRAYVEHIDRVGRDSAEVDRHDEYVEPILEQSVRRMGVGTTEQTPLRQWVERVVVGDARRRGETHQWMYDRVNLSALLHRVGFNNPERMDYQTSRIPDWTKYGLDRNEQGGEYKGDSLYVEAVK